jgi:ATP-dependent helicase/nuclease subunit A
LEWVLKALYAGPCKDALLQAVSDCAGTGCSELLQVFRHPPGQSSLISSALTREGFDEWAKEAGELDTSDLEERFSFEYPHRDAVNIPGKTSVSALSHTDAVITEKPAFARNDSMTAVDKGTAAHILMQRISIGAHTERTVRAELIRLQKAGLMTREQANAVNVSSVAAFFDSPLGKRLSASPRVEREWEFNHAKPACELPGMAGSTEPVLLQGIIDCAFLEGGEWVLIDYKTDFVPEGVAPEQAAEKHRLQIDLYKKALESLTGKTVRESYIHLLRIGESVRMD